MNRILQDITDFIFIQDQPRPADILLIPGSGRPQLCECAARLYREGYAPLVLPSGKHSYKKDCFDGPHEGREEYPGPYDSEWAYERDVLLRHGVPAEAILREDRSTHTVDNARFSREVTDALGLNIRTAILCCKAYHARRALMTYGWFFPETAFFVVPTETQNTGRDNWHLSAEGRERVLDEVGKCGAYFRVAAALWSTQGEEDLR